MFKITVLSFLFAFVFAQTPFCGDRNGNSEIKEIFSLNTKVELLFFFKKDCSKEAKDDFYENILNRPHPGGGYWPRDGIQATFGIDRNGYEGFGFKFSVDATQEQRNDIKRLLEESTLVHKVYENVVPDDINDL